MCDNPNCPHNPDGPRFLGDTAAAARSMIGLVSESFRMTADTLVADVHTLHGNDGIFRLVDHLVRCYALLPRIDDEPLFPELPTREEIRERGGDSLDDMDEENIDALWHTSVNGLHAAQKLYDMAINRVPYGPVITDVIRDMEFNEVRVVTQLLSFQIVCVLSELGRRDRDDEGREMHDYLDALISTRETEAMS